MKALAVLLVLFAFGSVFAVSLHKTSHHSQQHHRHRRSNDTLHLYDVLGGCGGAPGCGAVMTSIDGIPAYSNGGDQCTGNSCGGCPAACNYQCVELAQRYFNQRFGVQLIWPVQYAAQMCNSYPAGVSQTGSPGHGDLIVFSWDTYGHVAVIDSISGSTVNVVEQNGSPNGRASYDSGQAECFLTH